MAKSGIILMKINWCVGLVLGFAMMVCGTVADAQVGGPAVSPQIGGDTNGGLSEPAQADDALSHPNAKTDAPPRPKRPALHSIGSRPVGAR